MWRHFKLTKVKGTTTKLPMFSPIWSEFINCSSSVIEITCEWMEKRMTLIFTPPSSQRKLWGMIYDREVIFIVSKKNVMCRWKHFMRRECDVRQRSRVSFWLVGGVDLSWRSFSCSLKLRKCLSKTLKSFAISQDITSSAFGRLVKLFSSWFYF